MSNLDTFRALNKARTIGPWKWHSVDDGYYEVLAGPLEDPNYPSLDKNKVMDDGSASGEYATEITSDSPNGKFIVFLANNADNLLRLWDASQKVMDICDKPWGELYASVYTIEEDNYQAYYCRDLLDSVLKDLEND